MTEEEKKQVDAFVEQIQLEDSTSILQYGAGTQKKMSDFSEGTLEKVRSKDLGEIGDLLNGVVVELKGFDEEEERLNLKNYLHVTQIWKNIFQDVSCEKTAFDRDSTVENRMYCEKSGNLASPSCENVQEGWYSVDNLPGICTECGQ